MRAAPAGDGPCSESGTSVANRLWYQDAAATVCEDVVWDPYQACNGLATSMAEQSTSELDTEVPCQERQQISAYPGQAHRRFYADRLSGGLSCNATGFPPQSPTKGDAVMEYSNYYHVMQRKRHAASAFGATAGGRESGNLYSRFQGDAAAARTRSVQQGDAVHGGCLRSARRL